MVRGFNQQAGLGLENKAGCREHVSVLIPHTTAVGTGLRGTPNKITCKAVVKENTYLLNSNHRKMCNYTTSIRKALGCGQ